MRGLLRSILDSKGRVDLQIAVFPPFVPPEEGSRVVATDPFVSGVGGARKVIRSKGAVSYEEVPCSPAHVSFNLAPLHLARGRVD